MAESQFFTHAEILEVVSDVIPFKPLILKFFGREHITDQKKIYFDRLVKDQRIAVFINPMTVAKARPKKGFLVDSYEPGYIKEKDLIMPDHVFTRRPGEPMSAPMSNAERYQATLIDLAADQLVRLERRRELMATELLLNGQYTMTGENLSVEVDFDRAAGNTITLATTARWLDANTGVDPWEDLETWMNLCIQPIKYLVMGTAAWRTLKKSPKYEKMVYLDHLAGRSNYSLEIQKNEPEGATYRCTIAGTNTEIWTYAGVYTHPTTGADTLFLPTDAVLGIPDPNYGIQCYAAIQDADAQFTGMPYFYKNWVEKDPGIPLITMQSAPLIAHTKINSTFGVRTGATATGA